MCGIIGGNQSDVNYKEELQKLIHRGSDYQNLINFDNLFIGHNRLSIQGSINQPFIFEDYIITYNGELFNKTFEKYKYLYNGVSDTELLIRLYKHFKHDIKLFISELSGQFSFIIFDKIENKLIIGRDFIGRTTLYYSLNEKNEILIGSEKKIFKPSDIIINLDPTTYIEYNLLNNSLKQTKWYFYKPSNYDISATYEQHSKNIRSLLEKAIDNELLEGNKVCTILSGGIDSCIITYLISKKVPNLEAFVVHVSDSTKKNNRILKDDLYYAKIFANFLNIKLNIVEIDKNDILNNISKTEYHTETNNKIQNSFANPQLFLSKAIKDKGYKISFGGEVSDELFASYADVIRWSWNDPNKYEQKRLNLVKNLYFKNLETVNKTMLSNSVELRTPFADKDLVEYCLNIDPKFRDDNYGKGKIKKYLLRLSFIDCNFPEEILWRAKVPFQDGCHTDFLYK